MNQGPNQSASTFITPLTTNHHIASSRRSSVLSQSRISRIKDKRTVYPSSTLSKIVFISNFEGNGFQRENVFASDLPGDVDLDGMIRRVNRVCYEQWKKMFESIEEEPLANWEIAQKAIAVFMAFTFLIILYFMVTHDFVYSYVMLYGLVAIMIIGCISSYCLLKQKRKDFNKDEEMVKVIKRELTRLNELQLVERPQYSRFTWTCQKDCLWIACEFH